MTRLLAVLILFTAPAWASAQEFDDPAVVVCELVARANYEIAPIKVTRTSATVDGLNVQISFDRQILNSEPITQDLTCPFKLSGGKYMLDADPTVLRSVDAALAISGFYPINPSDTALR